jgi:hypothetical protein
VGARLLFRAVFTRVFAVSFQRQLFQDDWEAQNFRSPLGMALEGLHNDKPEIGNGSEHQLLIFSLKGLSLAARQRPQLSS